MSLWEKMTEEWIKQNLATAKAMAEGSPMPYQEAYVQHLEAIAEHAITPEKINKIIHERGKKRAKVEAW